jgi:hypothetical protein
MKSTRADVRTSADTHMVFVLPAEFHARAHAELSVDQLDLGPRPVIFEKPQAFEGLISQRLHKWPTRQQDVGSHRSGS